LAAEIRETRGIPLWLLREYLEEGGGRAADDHRVVGDGWEVRLTQIEDFVVGSLRVGQVRVDIDGSDAGVARVLAFLEPKLVRAGG
jgi:hypothetical protein